MQNLNFQVIDLTKSIVCNQGGCSAAFFVDRKQNEYLWIADTVDHQKIDKKEKLDGNVRVYIGKNIYVVPAWLTCYNY